MTETIVKSFRQKNNDGYSESIHFGSEPRYIDGLRESGIRNLEEELLLGGGGCFVQEYTSDANIHVIKEHFCVFSELEKKHYMLISAIQFINARPTVTENLYYIEGEDIKETDKPILTKITQYTADGLVHDSKITYPTNDNGDTL